MVDVREKKKGCQGRQERFRSERPRRLSWPKAMKLVMSEVIVMF